MKKIIVLLLFLALIFFGFAPVSAEIYEARQIPWSGHWWPFTEGELVNGYENDQEPPLAKYDMLVSGTAYGPAMKYGKQNFYYPYKDSWTGLCFYWAMSSILEAEPEHRSVHNNVIFNIGDKKGLLAAFYYNAIYDAHSVKKPENFHAVLEDNIASQRTSIIMDLGSSDEVWTYPVFKYETTFNQTGDVRHYETTIYYASYSDPDQTGTMVRNRTFYYYFQLDGDVVIDSGWENGSGQKPPKRAYIPLGRRPLSNAFDLDAGLIHEIAGSKDDPFHGNDSFDTASPIQSGGYCLIAFNSDFFTIYLENGDRLNIHLIPEISGSVTLGIYNADKKSVLDSTRKDYLVYQADEAGIHYLKIEPSGNENNPVYGLYILQALSRQSLFPLDPAGNWINGLALLQPDPEPGRVILSRIDKSGLPFKGNLIDIFGVRRTGICEGFNLSSAAMEGYIRVDSDWPVLGMQAVTSGNSSLKGNNMLSFDEASDELFFPHLAVSLFAGWQTTVGLINVSQQKEEILLQGYDPDGSVLVSESISLNRGEKKEFNISESFLTNAASMSATVDSRRTCLLGYMEYTNYSSSVQGCDVIPAASGQDRGELLIAPVGSLNGNWHSGVAVMNTGYETSEVFFSAMDSLGETVQTVSRVLKPNQKWVKVLGALFPGAVVENMASIRIESQNGQPLTGLVLYISGSGRQLAGIPLLPSSEEVLYVPHIASNNGWWTGLGLINAGKEEEWISFFLYDDNGTLLDTVEKGLFPGEQFNSSVRNLFNPDMVDSPGYIEITGSGNCPLSGAYLIGTQDGYKLMGDALAR